MSAWNRIAMAAATAAFGVSRAHAAACARACRRGTFEPFEIRGGEPRAIRASFRILPLETPRFWPSAR